MHLTTGRLAAPALFLGAGLLVLAGGGAIGQPGKDKEPGKEKEKKDKDKGPKDGPDKGAKELRKAFDGITEIAQGVPAGKEANRLFDHTKAVYRAAVKAYGDDPRRSGELAVAAKESVRGLDHLRRASFQPVPNLPEPPSDDGPPVPKDGLKGKDAPPPPKDGATGKDAPPPPKDGPQRKDTRDGPAPRGPWSPALDALTDAHTQLANAEVPTGGASKDFFEAARNVYRQARTAYEGGEYRKAAELARAADAWLRVTEHLARAQWDGPGTPAAAPEPKKKDAPPPPPPIK